MPSHSHRRGRTSARNMALLRKLALNLARREPGKGALRGKLKRAGWDNAFLVALLSQFTHIYMRLPRPTRPFNLTP